MICKEHSPLLSVEIIKMDICPGTAIVLGVLQSPQMFYQPGSCLEIFSHFSPFLVEATAVSPLRNSQNRYSKRPQVVTVQMLELPVPGLRFAIATHLQGAIWDGWCEHFVVSC
uniref:Uncharacterized protein n=1 Tax=Micrurus carvalhoi TaxID=3147026 RepID=A0A2H6N3A3_9SAUR